MTALRTRIRNYVPRILTSSVNVFLVMVGSIHACIAQKTRRMSSQHVRGLPMPSIQRPPRYRTPEQTRQSALYFLPAGFDCDLITFFTIFASSTRNARRMLVRSRSSDIEEFRSGQVDVPLLDAVTASRTTVCPAHGLLRLRDGSVLARPKGNNLASTALAFKFRTRRHETYTRQRDATVSALGCGRKLFDVVVNKLATWCLHNPSAVGGGVVGVTLAERDTLGHCGCYRNIWRGQHGALALTQPFQRILVPSAGSILASSRALFHLAHLHQSHLVPPHTRVAPCPSIISTHISDGRGEEYLKTRSQSLSYMLLGHKRACAP